MNYIDILGTLAATLTSASFVPQVVKTIRSRDTTSISLFMYSLFVTGVGCWLVWGIMVNQVPVIVANVVTFLLAAVILGMKLYAVIVKKEPI